MDPSLSTSSRRSYDIPKPETGLAEWTSKIKALQREVDADEEAEQKRLEEEISAARQARLRRSRGAGTGSRVDSIDMSSSAAQLRELGRTNDNSSNDAPKSGSERANNQETALRKLMGRNDVYNPDKTSAARIAADETKSLASFIGGRASGPRLNRHAPQPDAHDPTQYIQPDLSAPHPIFGKGGVAMPGMSINRDIKSTASTAGSELSERYQPSSAKVAPKATSTDALSQRSAVAPDSNKPTSFDIRRRSFTSKETLSSVTFSSSSPTPKDIPSKVSKVSEPSQSSRSLQSTISKTDTFVQSVEASRSFAPPTASKTLPSYLGTNYSTKIPPILNASQTAEPSGLNTPLRRLMETNNVYNPDQRDIPRKTIAERAQNVSLAGFIGGNGTGPRLNKPAPQPDAHDPTQFIQPDTSAPHPVFGKGGIAMPGLASRKPMGSSSPNDIVEHRPSSSIKAIWPPVQTPYAEKTQEVRSVSPQKTGNRERTISTPGDRSSGSNSSLPLDALSPSESPDMGRRSPSKGSRFPMPLGRDRTNSTPAKHNNFTVPITAPLARPIQPIPKAISSSPLISTTVPSPAFQKPTPSKDLTPSISRLQGRGFVQNMVKVSSQLDTPASPSPQSIDRSRPSSATGKKGSVLDRWQPHVRSPSPTKSSATFNSPMRRSATQDTNMYDNQSHSPSPFASNNGTSHTLKSIASLPSLPKSTSTQPTKLTNDENDVTPEPYQRSRTPGLGSATTMVLIKPSKSATDLTQLTHTRVDELGVKRESITTTSSKKPLIHPTKERARKPKKAVHPSSVADLSESRPAGEDDLVTFPKEIQPTLNYNSKQPERSPSPVHQILSIPPQAILQPRSELSQPMLPPPSPRKIDAATSNQYTEAEGGSDDLPAHILSPKSSPTSPVVSFTKLTRVPSTGSRPTVMEVAQTMMEQSGEMTPGNPTDHALLLGEAAGEDEAKPRSGASYFPNERRKSSHDKYSSFVLPSLKEEATPTPTPAGTLHLTTSNVHTIEEVAFEETDNDADALQEKYLNATPGATDLGLVRWEAAPETFPLVDIPMLLETPSKQPQITLDTQTISVEVLAIIGTSATPIAGPNSTFYESEILAVIHRIKSTSSGLASTSVWGWLGRRSILGDREERKLQDLAKRYGTSPKIVYQLAEPEELIKVLGGTLIIRQGSRNHWSIENTTMHLVRSLKGVMIIDELDLNAKNLCSAFSYCVTILGAVYVWHGRGSTVDERSAALRYADSLSNDITELLEGEGDDDEMFWMIFGDEDFARADYWRWRRNHSDALDPSIWRVDPNNLREPVHSVEFISLENSLQTAVYIVNCIWEFYVLVGKEARNDKRAIQFALQTATEMSREASDSRPYTPNVHVLILPSQIPLDLRLSIRDFDEAWLNSGEIPDHMNLLSYSDAVLHLSTHSWRKPALNDRDMLPLGIGISDVS